MENRIEWNTLWMNLAKDLAKRSTDTKHKVGCAIISSENDTVLSVGYNQDHKGGSNQRLSMETGCSGFIHAEINAITKLDYHNPAPRKMYVTLSPCYPCAQLIINSRIEKVYYLEKYCEKGLELLISSGIIVEQLNN